MFYLKLLFTYIGIRWRSQIEYPMAFALGFVAQWLVYGLEFVTLWIMVNAFGVLGSWQPLEVVFLYAMNTCTYALGASFVFHTQRDLPVMVRTGQFDDVLIKPVDSLIYMISATFNVGYLSHLTLCIATMAFSLSGLGIMLSPGMALWLVVMVISGAAIQAALHLLIAMPSLRIVNASGFAMVLFRLKGFIQYPLSIFGTPLQLLFTLALPLAFISFYPSQPILGKMDTLMFPPWIMYLSPVVAAGMLGLTWVCWHRVVDGYESSGS